MLGNNGELGTNATCSPPPWINSAKHRPYNEGQLRLGYRLRNGMFGHDCACGNDYPVNKTGITAIFIIQYTPGEQWSAGDGFLKTATEVFIKKQSRW
jgi:hypothetical protein